MIYIFRGRYIPNLYNLHGNSVHTGLPASELHTAEKEPRVLILTGKNFPAETNCIPARTPAPVRHIHESTIQRQKNE